MVKKLNSVIDRILDIMMVFSGVLVGVLTLIVSMGIFSRYFLNYPLVWVAEISGYCLLYIAFLVAAWLLKEEAHIKMDMILTSLKPSVQTIINTVTSAVSTLVCFILTWFGVKVTLDLFHANYFTPTFLELPKFVFTIAIAFGFLMLSIQFVRATCRYLRKWRALKYGIY